MKLGDKIGIIGLLILGIILMILGNSMKESYDALISQYSYVSDGSQLVFGNVLMALGGILLAGTLTGLIVSHLKLRSARGNVPTVKTNYEFSHGLNELAHAGRAVEMNSGIKIKCEKSFGQFLLTEKPVCTVNDGQPETMEWNKEFLISLEPNLPYKVSIHFPYINQNCGLASIAVQVKPNEVQGYEYHTPFLMTQSGTIDRKY